MMKKRKHEMFLRKYRTFRDRSHPLDVYDDETVFKEFRFHRHEIFAITDAVAQEVSVTNRRGSLIPLLQVVLALRFYASGAF